MSRRKPNSKLPSMQPGSVFGWLTSIGPAFAAGGIGERRRFVVCECKCGAIVCARTSALVSGQVRSCGCFHRDITRQRATIHGMSGTRLGGIWNHMKQRCLNPACDAYVHYGARGISVCDEWLKDSYAFMKWSLDNGYGDDLEIERRDNNGDYCPENCVWATRSAQMRNTRVTNRITAFGETKCLTEWCSDHRCVVTMSTITHRMRHGMSAEMAITTPKAGAYNRSPAEVEAAVIDDWKRTGDAMSMVGKRHGVSKRVVARVLLEKGLRKTGDPRSDSKAFRKAGVA